VRRERDYYLGAALLAACYDRTNLLGNTLGLLESSGEPWHRAERAAAAGLIRGRRIVTVAPQPASDGERRVRAELVVRSARAGATSAVFIASRSMRRCASLVSSQHSPRLRRAP
jgi:hypothetical protein